MTTIAQHLNALESFSSSLRAQADRMMAQASAADALRSHLRQLADSSIELDTYVAAVIAANPVTAVSAALDAVEAKPLEVVQPVVQGVVQ